MNTNHDNTPNEYIKLPTRLPMETWDIIEIGKEKASTQKPK